MLGCASNRLSAPERNEELKDFAPVGVVARKILFNFAVLFFLVLGETVPLCCVDPTTLPAESLEWLNATSISSRGALQLLHPFLLGIVPFVEASILIQVAGALIGWERLPVPPRFKLSRTQTQTPYGRAALTFLSGLVGATIATGFALLAAQHLISTGAVGHAEMWDITAALVAGSAIMYNISELITQYGLGQGVQFIYMVMIASSAHHLVHSFFLHTSCTLSSSTPVQGEMKLTANVLWLQECRAIGSVRSSACLV